MITLHSLQELAADCMAEVNTKLESDKIAGCVLCIDEKHAVKKLGDRTGIQLLVKYPSSDTEGRNEDNYSESNDLLIYVIEKWDEGQFNYQQEMDRFNLLQQVNRKVKGYFKHNIRALMCERSLDKPFHTEFEYMQFGSWNGLSNSFSVKDYDL